jgi:hypothetical protein
MKVLAADVEVGLPPSMPHDVPSDLLSGRYGDEARRP